MAEIRDYGTIGGVGLTGTPIDTARYSQVYQATHLGKDRLPYMRRSFISFTYGGKHIENFNLIATTSGDRWEREGYSSFDDLTSSYDNLDGQYYWGSHYKTQSITFVLATDGIDHKVLDEFLHWFLAGVSRELILSEHPNRARMARVQEPPQLSLLPFEGKTSMVINGETREVTTTLFKGEITLKLIMDEPHWYAIDNILGKKVDEYDNVTQTTKTRYIDWWVDANGNDVSIFASLDALKILYEDGIPLGSMIENNMLLGNQAYANVENRTEMLIWSQAEADIQLVDGLLIGGEGARINGTVTAGDDSIYAPGDYVGVIAGAIVDVSGNGIASLSHGQEAYFFYAGTAPSPTIVSFSIDPLFDGNGYFTSINNTYSSPYLPYNTLTIEASKKLLLTFTTPNLITSYNKAVFILLNGFGNSSTVLEMRDEILTKVRHPAVRVWANALLNEDTDLAVDVVVIKDKMQSFFKLNDLTYAPMTFSFNSKTGEAIGEFTYRTPEENMSLFDFIYAENALNKINTIKSNDSTLDDQKRYENLVTWGWSQYCLGTNNLLVEPIVDRPNTYKLAVEAFLDYIDKCKEEGVSIPTIFTAYSSVVDLSTLVIATEDVGDMLTSNNLIITERNYPNESGKIVRWRSSPEKARTYSHRLTHDLDVPLKNLQIIYKNMYL